jgi:hypothetical protein
MVITFAERTNLRQNVRWLEKGRTQKLFILLALFCRGIGIVISLCGIRLGVLLLTTSRTFQGFFLETWIFHRLYSVQ